MRASVVPATTSGRVVSVGRRLTPSKRRSTSRTRIKSLDTSCVVEVILDDHDNPESQETRQRLLKALARADIYPDARGRLSIPGRPALDVHVAGLPDESGIRLQLARLARLEQEPEEMIGAAKELVEATAKHVLRETGEEIPS